MSSINVLPDWKVRVRAALDWLGRSQDVASGGGSAAYWSPLRGWSAPYPETSGYIIPTLWRAADQLNDPQLADRAERMAGWLTGIQHASGAFSGGLHRPGQDQPPSIFNTGQILFGLTEAARRTRLSRFRTAADAAARWLIDQQQADGRWTKHAYHNGHAPSYYAHVCWPLAEYWRWRGVEAAREAVERGLEAVLRDRQSNGVFAHWSFTPDRPAFTHTIAYTLQGVIESAAIIDRWDSLATPAVETAEKLLRKSAIRGRLAGAFDNRWEPSGWYVCLTGNCQMASTWLRIHRRQADPRLLSGALDAMLVVCSRQRLQPKRPNVHGAIAGSAPLYGRYMAMRYPNWAAKFFVDALTQLAQCLDELDAEPVNRYLRMAS